MRSKLEGLLCILVIFNAGKLEHKQIFLWQLLVFSNLYNGDNSRWCIVKTFFNTKSKAFKFSKMTITVMTFIYYDPVGDRVVASVAERQKSNAFSVKLKVLEWFQNMHIARNYICMLFGGCLYTPCHSHRETRLK